MNFFLGLIINPHSDNSPNTCEKKGCIDDKHTSALLSPYYKGKIQGLDEPAYITNSVRAVACPVGSYVWYYADFEVVYDFCSCNFKSDLSFEFWVLD